jgi:hypothetical protein
MTKRGLLRKLSALARAIVGIESEEEKGLAAVHAAATELSRIQRELDEAHKERMEALVEACDQALARERDEAKRRELTARRPELAQQAQTRRQASDDDFTLQALVEVARHRLPQLLGIDEQAARQLLIQTLFWGRDGSPDECLRNLGALFAAVPRLSEVPRQLGTATFRALLSPALEAGDIERVRHRFAELQGLDPSSAERVTLPDLLQPDFDAQEFIARGK